jgi:glutathione S-transferase
MTLSLCYSPLSPFCRKVRMAMDFKQLTFQLIEADRLEDIPVWNPRAEVPVLMHGDTVVCNSSDILAYLDRRYDESPLYPGGATRFAEVREWERTADTQLDAIVAVIGNWQFADLPPMPAGLLDAARRDLGQIYDRLQQQLSTREFICGAVGAADFAVYPHLATANAIGLKFDPARHRDVQRWVKAIRARPEGQIDTAAVREWWANRASHDVDTRRVNWGSYRLEWLLANGHADWFAEQVRQDKVLWSTGPANNAFNSPVAPARKA